MITHLHTHSSYSFLEALPSPAELVQAAVDANMPALALTDHNRLTGALEFYAACREVGIQPILGLELDVTPPSELSTFVNPSLSPYPAGAVRPGPARLGSSLPPCQPVSIRFCRVTSCTIRPFDW